MTNRREQVIARLEENLQEIVERYRSMDAASLATQVYEDEPQWTVKQLLAHLVTIEKSMQWLFKDILAGGPGSPEDFDIDRFNRIQPAKLDPLTTEELLSQFEAVRRKTISIVAAMEQGDLDREGRHAFHGPGTLERFVHWAHEHTDIHLADLRKALKA